MDIKNNQRIASTLYGESGKNEITYLKNRLSRKTENNIGKVNKPIHIFLQYWN